MVIEKILILEDHAGLRTALQMHLTGKGFQVAERGSIAQCKKYLDTEGCDLLIADINLPDGNSLDLLESLKKQNLSTMVIVISGQSTVETAVECMQRGAFDYLVKPFSMAQLDVAIGKAVKYTKLITVNNFLNNVPAERSSMELLGNSAPMRKLSELIGRVAKTDATVLIQGESGTGKELIARALFSQSARSREPYIKVNCAAIPETLIESEFFGHEKGAFTGATHKREGRFELAHNGTILMDEVSEVALGVQAKLLRVLQERELERLGGSRTIKVDCRVIATTNRSLQESVKRKEFRADLYYRLNVVPIYVPPLRERTEDIPLLAEHFVGRFSRKHGIRIHGISDRAIAALARHSWPGNVRELENVIERAVIMSGDGELIEPETLGLDSTLPNSNSRIETATKISTEDLNEPALSLESPAVSLAELEKEHILQILEQSAGNRTRAAEKLGITVRTLRNKLKLYSTE